MKHSYLARRAIVLVAFFSFTACDKDQEITPQEIIEVEPDAATLSAYFSENFESAYKSSYAPELVTFTNGTWNFDDALTGNSTSDRKSGTQSARVRNSGKLTMAFDVAEGAKSFTMRYARFGSDKATTLQVF